jgi:transglutaminase-like putative cysteine protease
VEAIVQRLRGEFVHDDAATVPEDCDDAVGHFLACRRGPDYLFASSAAVLLRLRGFPTRLVSGLYADSKRFDRVTSQTAVLKQDAHVWLEVAAASGVWVPVEPTPGYEPPRTVRTLGEAARAFVALLWARARAHWPGVFGAAACAVLAVVKRRRVADALVWLIWRARMIGGPRRAVLATIWLLEWRARLAGGSRPQWKTLDAWYGDRLAEARPGRAAAAEVVSLADRILYAPCGGRLPLSAPDVRTVCRETVRQLSFDALSGRRGPDV